MPVRRLSEETYKAAEPYIIERYELKDGNVVWKNPHGRIAGGFNDKGYRQIRVYGHFFQAHRVAFFLHYGRWPEGDIDHVNGVRDDNRPENLREVDKSVNARNSKARPKFNRYGVEEPGICYAVTKAKRKNGSVKPYGALILRYRTKDGDRKSITVRPPARLPIGTWDEESMRKIKAIRDRVWFENGYHENHGRCA